MRAVTTVLSFNGAAPVKARKCVEEVRLNLDTRVLQWGRAGEGAEITGAGPLLYSFYALQWGRAGEGAEIELYQKAWQSAYKLQWGRAGEGAEIS